MPSMVIKLEPEGAWPDLAEKDAAGNLIHLANDAPAIQLLCLPGGMSSGKPSIAFRVDLPDGKTLLYETSLACFQMANAAFLAKHGDVT